MLTTERDHRIKVQFPWQRGDAPNPGGLSAEATGKKGHAPGNDQSGTWVRVGEWQAGPNWGSHCLPRIGSEVLIDYLDGDIDRPVIIGAAYNGADLPPFAAGHESAANHPGVLAGWMSHNHEAGHNQWLIDDAPESATRGPWRGAGVELRTDAWLTLRAGEGILLSTTARPNGQSTPMDVMETVGQLKAAEETAKALSDAAAKQGPQPLKANADQTAFIQSIDPQQDGQYQGSIGGQPAKKATPGSRDPGEPTERFAQPHVLLEAPSDISHASPASTLLYAGQNLHLTSQQDLHIAAAHTHALTIGHGASGYAHQGGIKSIAQAGSHTLQAHTDQMEILADQSITVTSSNDEIHILAKEKIVLQAGQSSITLDGQNITFACPGMFSVKGSGHAFMGPGSGGAQRETLPDSRVKMFREQFKAVDEDSGQVLANLPYRIELGDGSIIRGVTDEAGLTVPVMTADPQSAKLYWEPLPVADAGVADDGLDGGC